MWCVRHDDLLDDGVLQGLALLNQPGTGPDQTGEVTGRMDGFCPCGTALAKGAVAIAGEGVDVAHEV